MIIYYKILNNAVSVRILKPMSKNKEINETFFEKKSKILTIEQVREKIPSPYNGIIISYMMRVKEINSMKLSKFGVKRQEGTNIKIYCVGNCEFFDIETAIAHGQMIYGIEFMEEQKSKLYGEKMYFFKDLSDISETYYNNLISEYYSLTKIRSFEIDKEKKPTFKKY